MLFYLWERISDLTGIYASTWPVAVPTPADFELQSQSDSESQSEIES